MSAPFVEQGRNATNRGPSHFRSQVGPPWIQNNLFRAWGPVPVRVTSTRRSNHPIVTPLLWSITSLLQPTLLFRHPNLSFWRCTVALSNQSASMPLSLSVDRSRLLTRLDRRPLRLVVSAICDDRVQLTALASV